MEEALTSSSLDARRREAELFKLALLNLHAPGCHKLANLLIAHCRVSVSPWKFVASDRTSRRILKHPSEKPGSKRHTRLNGHHVLIRWPSLCRHLVAPAPHLVSLQLGGSPGSRMATISPLCTSVHLVSLTSRTQSFRPHKHGRAWTWQQRALSALL